MRSLVLCTCIICWMTPEASGQSYEMKIHLKNGETVAIPIDEIRRLVFLQATGVVDQETGDPAPLTFQMLQNYPNPFNPSTTIVYDIPARSDVSVRIFDLKGSLIRDLVHEAQCAGRYQVAWDGTDNTRALVSSGIYFAVVQSGEQLLSRKLILLK